MTNRKEEAMTEIDKPSPSLGLAKLFANRIGSPWGEGADYGKRMKEDDPDPDDIHPNGRISSHFDDDSFEEFVSDLSEAIDRLIVEAKLEQIDEIIDIQEKQFNRWTQKDIAHFFERVGVIYRKLSNNLSKGDEKNE